MPVKTEKELSEGLHAVWLKAVAAIELRNFGYAISLLQEILKQEPEFLTGRQLLRRAEVTKSKSTKKSFFNISTASIGVMKAQREIKKDPKRAVEMLEEVLEAEPYNRQANLFLKEAALAAGWPEIGVFALRTLLEENSRDVKVLHELGRLYHDIGDHENEVEVYNQITAINPLDAQALRLGKDASARASMKRGGWTQAESYRDLIKDKEEAISLEQQSRIPLDRRSARSTDCRNLRASPGGAGKPRLCATPRRTERAKGRFRVSHSLVSIRCRSDQRCGDRHYFGRFPI